MKKIKYNDRVKNLIQKIIMSRDDPKESLPSSSRSKSVQSSEEESSNLKITESKDSNVFAKSRYCKIDEESSYTCSESLKSCENTESVLTKKDENVQNVKKEMILSGRYEMKENLEETKSTGESNTAI